VQASVAAPSETPTGKDSCEQIPGRPVARFELARHDLPNPGSTIDRLFESTRAAWEELEAAPQHRLLWKETGPNHFRVVIWTPERRGSSSIEVVREPPGAMWSHGHLARAGTINCVLHRYVLTVEGGVGRLRDLVEVRTNSSLLTFYRRPLERAAMHAADERLDDFVRELRQG
jgi:hypothetical protein